MTCSIIKADCIDFLRSKPADSFDLVFGSPPYTDARTYGRNDVSRHCFEWVEWMLEVTTETVRVSRGPVFWVAAGVQRDNVYQPACEGLMWEWYKRGNHLWCPAVWWKVDDDEGGTGIPGSGGNTHGKRWLRKDWEYIMVFSRGQPLPFDHPEVMGHNPVYGRVGGEMSNRTEDGRRTNQRQRGPWNTGQCGIGGRTRNGQKKSRKVINAMDAPAGTNGDGTRKENSKRLMPKIVNPGNVLPMIVKARVGGGHMGGDAFCSQNEAPFPEKLAEFFVKSYCKPGGTVCDPFSGSGTTAAVCVEHGRNFYGCDIRQSQIDLGLKRVATVTPSMFTS